MVGVFMSGPCLPLSPSYEYIIIDYPAAVDEEQSDDMEIDSEAASEVEGGCCTGSLLSEILNS